jgi:hypothetical protein
MNDIRKCVITMNTRTMKLCGSKYKLIPGDHIIVDATIINKNGHYPVVVIPIGTPCIESFHVANGKKIVDETLISGIGTINGGIPRRRKHK